MTRSTLSPRVCLLALLLASWGGGVLASSYVVAVIDPDRVVERSPQYEAARRELQQAVADREKKLREQQEELTALQDRLERDSALMSTEEAQRLTNDIRNRDRKLKYAQGEAREDLTLRQNEMRTKLGKQVEEVVTELAKERGELEDRVGKVIGNLDGRSVATSAPAARRALCGKSRRPCPSDSRGDRERQCLVFQCNLHCLLRFRRCGRSELTAVVLLAVPAP